MPEQPKYKDWQVPPQATDEDRKLAWLNEGVEEGQAWLRLQRGAEDFRKTLDVFSGRPSPAEIPVYRSQIQTGRLKRNVKEVVGACANIRPIWGYTSDNSAFEPYAGTMNKATRAIYLERGLDESIKKVLQWSAATCTGWLRPVYRRNMYGTGEGNLTFLTYGSPSVVPVQLPANNDWQEAYAVHILDELPIAMAHGMFPAFQERLRPTSSKYWYSPEIRRATKGNLFQRIFGRWGRAANALLSDLYIPIRYTYVIDLSINETGNDIPMGEYGTPWSYKVPSKGSMIQVGTNRDGSPLYREANENDARLYPYRRLLISSESCVMYDGPAFDWHGELPLIPFCLDDWAWEAIGFSIIRDGYQIHQSMNELERGVMDKHRARLDPALGYDINAVNPNEANNFDPMQPRARIGFDGSAVEKPFQEVVPEEMLRVDPSTPIFIEHLKDTMDYQLAIRDIVALAKARAMGGGVTDPEKIMEADGPIVRDISRNVERALAKAGNQCKYIIIQNYTSARVMRYVGADGMAWETFDYDPDALYPSHLPEELPPAFKPSENWHPGLPLSPSPSQYSRVQRGRWMAKNLSLQITPHSVHEIVQMSHKLGLIQLRKSGVQIDSQTIAEAWDLGNFGHLDGNTILDKWKSEQEMLAQFALRVKQMVDAIQQGGVSPPGALLAAAAQLAGGQTQEGRPPSGQVAPTMQQKDGGTRTTISESGS